MSRGKTAPVFVAGGHDHRLCIATAVAAAAELCSARAVRLTALRRRVLELVWGSHRPIGAYEILDTLRTKGRSAAPPTVYRALDFLLAQGLIHRIESRNAFVGCASPGDPHSGQFLICTACGNSLEVHDEEVVDSLRRSAERHGFHIQDQTVEIRGLCTVCRPVAEDGPHGG